ncbi:hypothetical protein AVEN_166602-1 [Araneus ventricosus]|uniref:Uncharacterized protein n=1 Tax=Araneus ventricosus TaxID=182803 RepID=A0A4Y2UC15_ARAVE|nr:hypothetical protein AVEN_166602-1 [Araneus ventricosus]
MILVCGDTSLEVEIGGSCENSKMFPLLIDAPYYFGLLWFKKRGGFSWRSLLEICLISRSETAKNRCCSRVCGGGSNIPQKCRQMLKRRESTDGDLNTVCPP